MIATQDDKQPYSPYSETDVSTSGPTIQPEVAAIEEVSQRKLAEEDLTGLEASLVPSNIRGAGVTDGFAAPPDSTLDQGIAIQGTDRESRIERADEDNPAYPPDELEASQEIPDFSVLKDRAAKVGIDIHDYLDESDMTIPEAPILVEMLLKEIIDAEFGVEHLTVVKPEKEVVYDIELRPDRVVNQGLHYFLEKTLEEHPSFLTDIWEKADVVEVTVKPDGEESMISVWKKVPRGKREDDAPIKVSMSLENFFRMCSVPVVDNGKSRFATPVIKSDSLNDYKQLLSSMERMKVDGSPIGGNARPTYIIRLGRFRDHH